ncbi:MAG: hypothetical protein ACMG6H_16775, partial [Acidobacteriota bacterium]
MRAGNLHRVPLTVISRFGLATILLLTCAIIAGAYTLVLRDGRRIEVPSNFELTKTTLTYEAAPGFSKTIQLILVDVAATERANNEVAGALLKHAAQKLAAALPPAARHAKTTLTNRDLEPIRQRRIVSEQDYEKRRIELGLPSIEETRRQRAREEETLLAQIRAQALAQANDEAYWRGRAGALRGDILATDAEINYLRARLSEVGQFPLATHSLVTSVLPLVPLATNSAVVPPRVFNPGIFVAPRAGSALARPRGQVLIPRSPSPFRGQRFARPFAGTGFFNGGGFGYAYP